MPNLYAFDDCTILHLCEIEIPKAYSFLGNSLTHPNFKKLKALIEQLESTSIPVFRFVPSNIEYNIIKVANQLIQRAQINLLTDVFRAEVVNQIEEFTQSITTKFKEFDKCEEIAAIKAIFTKNERTLKKEQNIPEDDDLSIIAGYINQQSSGKKYFISEDEHFWGYKDIILREFVIHVIEEWNCLLVLND